MMDTLFPFGFPGPTAFYLTAYVATLAIHVVFMNYVIAGCGYLVVAACGKAGLERTVRQATAAGILRDWMPFAVSAAITAGVAPLLFIQILYQHPFYTANLLLFHRWMAILPALIIGFYLLYVFKSQRVLRWAPLPRMLVILGAFVCFGFTGWSWSENHLLGTRSNLWPVLYGSATMTFHDAELLPRIAVWLAGSIPTLAVVVAWQLYYLRTHGGIAMEPGHSRGLAGLALSGIVLSVMAGGVYYLNGGDAVRGVMTSRLGGPYLAVAVAGLVVQGLAWIAPWRRSALTGAGLVTASIGLLLTICGATIVREAIRLRSIDVSTFYEAHQQAFGIGGLPVFLVFFVLNGGLIAVCVLLVKRSTPTAGAAM